MTRIALTRLAPIAAALALGALAALAFVDTPAETQERAPRMSFELDRGIVELRRPGVAHCVGFVWTRDDASGNPLETWALFRERTDGGWLYPGEDNPNLTVRFTFAGGTPPSTLGEFLDWCEDQYPPSMNVDQTLDFSVHEHKVEIL